MTDCDLFRKGISTKDVADYKVAVGEVDVSRNKNVKWLDVQSLVITSTNENQINNDILLIRLKESLNLDEVVRRW